MLDAVSGFRPAPFAGDRLGRVLSASPRRAPLAAAGSLIFHVVLAGLLLTAVRLRDPLPFLPDEAVEVVFDDAPASPPTPAAEAPASPSGQAAPAISTALAPLQAGPPPTEPLPAEPPPTQTAPPPEAASPEALPAPDPPALPAAPSDPEPPLASRAEPPPQPAPEPEPLPLPPVVPAPANPEPATRQMQPPAPAPRPAPRRPPPPRPALRHGPEEAPSPAPAATAASPARTQAPSPTPPFQPSAPVPPVEASPAWRGALGAWVQSHRVYPAAARAAGHEGRVSIRFTVDRTGRVLSAQVVSSSGSSLLDEGARSLLANAQLPPFPPAMPQPQQTVVLGIQYNLER